MVKFVIAVVTALTIYLYLLVQVYAATSRADAAKWTHYYDDSGHQTCISKRDATGQVHYYCNK